MSDEYLGRSTMTYSANLSQFDLNLENYCLKSLHTFGAVRSYPLIGEILGPLKFGVIRYSGTCLHVEVCLLPAVKCI